MEAYGIRDFVALMLGISLHFIRATYALFISHLNACNPKHRFQARNQLVGRMYAPVVAQLYSGSRLC